MAWNTDQVLALAPDPGSAKSGKDLGVARKWVTLGTDGKSAWGTIQGSGKTPYQASIDLAGPAFKCTCPSRKFPCKHGLGLFLILVQQPAALTESAPPAWTTEWLAKRVEKEEKKAAQEAAPSQPPDLEAAAKAAVAAEKRAASRESRVSAGLDDLATWLNDIVRSGFATLPGKPSAYWQTPAARLVDAQAPGLARRVAELDGVTTAGEAWPRTLLRKAALLHLAREGWSRLGSLAPKHQADLRSVIGLPLAQEEVLAQTGLRDRWLVLGRRIVEEDRLRTQRTWLWGRTSNRPALCLSFSATASQPLDMSLTPGTEVDAELAFFPSASPLRALVKQRHGQPSGDAPVALAHATIVDANRFAAEAFAANPWTERVPFALAKVIPVRRACGWIVRDAAGHGLPLAISDATAWKLVALAGGQSLALTGEWDGETLTPLATWVERRFLTL